MKEVLDLLLHLQDHLHGFIRQYGLFIYALLFLIVFCETGLVVTPFLPGDSLLFAVGAITADPQSGLDVWIAAGVLIVAAILGDTLNYRIGNKFSGWAIQKFPRIIKQSHLDRTFAPFVAGSGAVPYKRFMMFNVVGALRWVGLILPAGWYFGNFPVVKDNFEFVVLGIIAVSVLPMVIEISRAKFGCRKDALAFPD